jgi:hypothetical protein
MRTANPMKRLTLISLLLAGAATTARAEDVQGTVRVVGPAAVQKVILTEAGRNDGTAVCRNEVGKRVGRLTGMTVKVTGAWHLNKAGEKTCVDATDFTVLNLPNGRTAVVGTLGEKDGGFAVSADDGKVHSLVDVPDGLKKLSGKKVILDLKVIESPAATSVPAKVVSYSEFP